MRYAFELRRAAPQEAHPRAQDQRARARGRALAAHRRRGRGRVPGVAVDYLHVDAATIFLVTNPARFDVIVTDNLFGDILTDLAGAISGGIGLAASGNINPDGAFPSMFEPVHGSAPDIAGQQKADPTAAILSVALLLDHLGLADAAATRRRRRSPPTSPPRGDRAARRPPRSATRSPALAVTAHALDHTHYEKDHHDQQPARHRHPALEFAVTAQRRRRSARPSATRSSPNPGFGKHFTDHMVDICWSVEGRLAPPARAAVRPDRARPGRRGAALRAGDLRGAQGLPPRGRLDLDASAPSRTPRACSARAAPPRAARAADRVLHRVAQAAHRRRRRLGAGRGGDEPLPAPVHVRQGGVPRRAPGGEGQLLRDRQPGRRLLHGRRQPRCRSGCRPTTRARARAARARPRPAATTPRRSSPRPRPTRTAAPRCCSSTPRRASTSKSSAA